MHDPATVERLRAQHQASGHALASHAGYWLRFALLAAAAAALVRVALIEPFNIPSNSMNPGLEAGDHLFVDKTAYGYSLASVPLGLFGDALSVSGRLFGRLPERGDVVVFVGPGAARTDYVKRVIGLPGDRVAMRGGRLVLNGAPVPCVAVSARACRETIGGHAYAVLDAGGGPYATVRPFTVPAGRLFVLGDNRADSADSRVSPANGGVGLVPTDALVGRAARVFFSWGPEGMRWRRMGRAVR